MYLQIILINDSICLESVLLELIFSKTITGSNYKQFSYKVLKLGNQFFGHISILTNIKYIAEQFYNMNDTSFTNMQKKIKNIISDKHS